VVVVATAATVLATGIAMAPTEAAPARRAASAPEAGPTLKADYKFKNNRRSPSPSAPALFDVGSGGTSTFATENVDGTNRTVLRFPDGNGLQLIDATNVIPRNRYTIVVKFRFDDVSNYGRVIDFSRALSDNGPYVLAGQFIFHPNDTSTVVNIDTDEWVNVALTRSQAGRLRGYVDGAQVFDFTDPAAGKIGELNTLRFFRDNDNREETSGAVSRIRLYDNGMTPAQVAALGS
jgi:hypothetical protein